MSSLKKTIKLFFFFLPVLFSLTATQAQTGVGQTTSAPLRVLVIGNSFSRNATHYLPDLAKEAGHVLVIGKAEISGGSLKMHWDGVVAAEANPDDPKGKPYQGKSLKALLSEGKWNVITLQQGSVVSGDIKTYNPFFRELYDYIKKFQPDAEIVVHQTWAYRNDAKYFTRTDDTIRAKSQEEMYVKSRKTYHEIADQFKLRIIPNGDAFWKVSSDKKWAYQKDEKFNFNNPEYPNLPTQTNSLHVGYTWTPKKVFKLDANHANTAGCYLGALTWFGFLFDESPAKLKFVPEGVDKDFAEYLRKSAWNAVTASRKK